MTRQSDNKGLGPGVYYAHEAYAGLLARFLIIAIDLGVMLALGVILYMVCSGLPDDNDPAAWFFGTWVLATYVYLVFIESSSVGTLGFLLTGMKIVNLKGERPSFLRMTFRLLLWALGPFNPVIDFLWLSGDPNRQTLRDKLAGTYVINKKAIPCGEGIVRLRTYFFFGLAVLFPEVQPVHANARVPSDTIS